MRIFGLYFLTARQFADKCDEVRKEQRKIDGIITAKLLEDNVILSGLVRSDKHGTKRLKRV